MNIQVACLPFPSWFFCYDYLRQCVRVDALPVFQRFYVHCLFFKDQRMANYNRVIIMGNLTRDPEYKQLASGQSVCKLGLASNRQFKNRQTDTMVQEVCFIDVDVWGPQADSCNQYLQKGRAVLVEGRLKFDSWQDNNGQTRSKHLIVADRVMFLSQAQSSEMADSTQSKTVAKKDQSSAYVKTKVDRASTVDAKLEKELLDQIEAIKNKSEKKTDVKAATKVESDSAKATLDRAKKEEAAPEASAATFKDEPPFEDDLPF